MLKVDHYVLKASEVFGVAVEDVTKEMRREGKRLFFQEMYSTRTQHIKGVMELKLASCTYQLQALNGALAFAEVNKAGCNIQRLIEAGKIELLTELLDELANPNG